MHTHFPQAELGTGRWLCRDCNEVLVMTEEDMILFRARVMAAIRDTNDG